MQNLWFPPNLLWGALERLLEKLDRHPPGRWKLALSGAPQGGRAIQTVRCFGQRKENRLPLGASVNSHAGRHSGSHVCDGNGTGLPLHWGRGPAGWIYLVMILSRNREKPSSK